MNEPKRRGRPPKARIEGADVPAQPEPMLMDNKPGEFERRQALAYALRIWHGQSPDLSRHEREGRIRDALKAQGMSMEGVELP
jgi:hypothetical protein